MKVILLCDVPKQGKKNQIIDVSDGYGNNYLIKNKLAILANKENVHNLEKLLERKNNNENALIEDLNKVKEKLEKEKIIIKVKTGVEDKLFGTVSVKQVLSKLNDMEYNIAKGSIIIDNPINSLGVHVIKIILHKKVIAKVKIEVTK